MTRSQIYKDRQLRHRAHPLRSCGDDLPIVLASKYHAYAVLVPVATVAFLLLAAVLFLLCVPAWSLATNVALRTETTILQRVADEAAAGGTGAGRSSLRVSPRPSR